jgi:hypothetical protein
VSIGKISSPGFSRTPRPSCTKKPCDLRRQPFREARPGAAESSAPETSDLRFIKRPPDDRQRRTPRRSAPAKGRGFGDHDPTAPRTTPMGGPAQ